MARAKRKKAEGGETPEKTEYQPSGPELTALKNYVDRGTSKPSIRLKALGADPDSAFTPDHPHPVVGQALLMQALGTSDNAFADGLLNQLVSLSSQGDGLDDARLNFLLSIINGIAPRDQLEAMLAAQMAAVHEASMTAARQLRHVDNIPQHDSAERAFNKLTRTFTTQMEALKRYRTGGEQKVTVHHVSVSEGGQAIVGNVTQAAPKAAPERQAAAPPLALTHDDAVPMPIMEESKRPMPVARKRGGSR